MCIIDFKLKTRVYYTSWHCHAYTPATCVIQQTNIRYCFFDAWLLHIYIYLISWVPEGCDGMSMGTEQIPSQLHTKIGHGVQEVQKD